MKLRSPGGIFCPKIVPGHMEEMQREKDMTLGANAYNLSVFTEICEKLFNIWRPKSFFSGRNFMGISVLHVLLGLSYAISFVGMKPTHGLIKYTVLKRYMFASSYKIFYTFCCAQHLFLYKIDQLFSLLMFWFIEQ